MNDQTNSQHQHADHPRQSPPTHQSAGNAADLLGPQQVLAAQEQGNAAALNGDHISTCPWKDAESDRECALRRMWIRGYAAGRTDLRSARASEAQRQSPPDGDERRE